MIIVYYDNKEIESLVNTGKCSIYKDLTQKKSFMNNLHAFLFLINALDNISELSPFKQFKYARKKFSSVIIKGIGVVKRLVFLEQDNGKAINILDLL